LVRNASIDGDGRKSKATSPAKTGVMNGKKRNGIIGNGCAQGGAGNRQLKNERKSEEYLKIHLANDQRKPDTEKNNGAKGEGSPGRNGEGVKQWQRERKEPKQKDVLVGVRP